MIKMPIVFENTIIKENASTIIDYINNHTSDFGELGSDYWQGRVIHIPQIRDKNIVDIIKDGKNYMVQEFVKILNLDRPVYVDTLHLVRWTESYELHPHADSEEPDGKQHQFYWRDFGTVTFLNEDFEGGVLYYPNKENLQVPAKTGYSAIHDGTMNCLHGVSKITKGVRYTIASFLTFDKNHSYDI